MGPFQDDNQTAVWAALRVRSTDRQEALANLDRLGPDSKARKSAMKNERLQRLQPCWLGAEQRRRLGCGNANAQAHSLTDTRVLNSRFRDNIKRFGGSADLRLLKVQLVVQATTWKKETIMTRA